MSDVLDVNGDPFVPGVVHYSTVVTVSCADCSWHSSASPDEALRLAEQHEARYYEHHVEER